MPIPILAAKLYIPPPRPELVRRLRLLQRLETGLARKLTLISASAGFGKTTLLSAWVAERKKPVAWLSLDEADSDPARFLSYLISALRMVQPGLGEAALTALDSAQPPSPETLLTGLLDEIGALAEPLVLILDDYHRVDSRAVDDSLAFLVDYLPRQLHLVIASREDPPLPLARLRARGQLTEMRVADLRFTSEEAADFLQRMSLNLSQEGVSALEVRTEGWIAGLQLAALSLQSREDAAAFIQAFTGSHRFVLDYLIEEVLQRQPVEVRDFLFQTAILDRVCARLCNALTGQEDGSLMLASLERGNLFLIPLDDQRQWYRYHHLFAEVLRAHLSEASPDQVAPLHRRASAWFEQNGLRPDAIRHALAANDLERAAGLIELAWPTAEEGTHSQAAWLSWAKALPEDLILARPVLTACYAYALLGLGEIDAAEVRFNEADRWLEPPKPGKVEAQIPSVAMVVADQNQWQLLPATIAIGRAFIAQSRGRIQDTVRYASQVLELHSADDSYRHSQAAMMLGMTYWASGDLTAAERIFADYTRKLRDTGNIPDAISTSVVLAEIRLALGRLKEATRTIQQLLDHVLDQGQPITPHIADLHRELGELCLEQGQIENAARQFQLSQSFGEKAELPVWRYRWYIAQACLSAAQADYDRALGLLDEAERLYIRTPLPVSHPISAQKARIWLSQGRLDQAMHWAREQGLTPEDDLSYLNEYVYFTFARILIAQYMLYRQGDTIRGAVRLLERMLITAQEGTRWGSVIEALVLLGRAHQAQGDGAAARSVIERALTLAEPEGFVRIFTGEGPDLLALLREAAKHEGAPAYVGQLLAISEGRQPFPSTSTETAPRNDSERPRGQTTLFEPLSERELDVLRLLRTDLSGPEIARELVVSLSTLRTHTQHIFAKLGVNNRRAAARRSEELHLK